MGRWRAGENGGEEEGDVPVHIALEMWIFVSWQLQKKPFLLTFTQGLALRRSLNLGGSNLCPGFAEIPSSPRTPKALGTGG